MNKLAELETFVSINNPVVFGICESHIDSDTPDELICPTGYRVFRKDRNRFGGGVAVMIRKDVLVTEVTVSNNYDSVELCCVDLKFGDDYLRVIVYYRPPYYTFTDEQYLDLSLQCLSSLLTNTTSPIILMGDFNFPKVDWTHYSAPENPLYNKFMTFVNENGLSQFVLQPTRQDNILDLVFTNASNLISDLQVDYTFSTSDHQLVKFSVNAGDSEVIATNNQDDGLLYYDFACADYDAMATYLSNVDWFYEFSFVFNVDEYWHIFVYHLNVAIESYVPVKRKRISLSNNKKRSYPKSIRHMLNRKNVYWKRWRMTNDPRHNQAYKAYSAKCKEAIKDYYRNLEIKLVQSDNLGRFYRYVNGKMSGRKLIPPIKNAAGNLITDNVSRANIFNEYFASVFTRDDNNLPQFTKRVDSTVKCCDVCFTPAKVLKVLQGLKSKNSHGPDGFPNILLKRLSTALCHPLAFVFQASFRSHVLPASWLHAIVIPVFKKGPTSSTSNYRPISLTCVCCRVMERIINQELLSYLYQHGLISKCQHGFLHKRSTCTNLLESVYDWSIALNNKLTTDIVYIDFQKAFDTVSHQKLLNKLEGYGICGDLLAWLTAFLSNRTQVVSINGCTSDTVSITSGVPQGSVLGPTLFLLFINDIDEIFCGTNVCMKLFADDAKLYSSFDNFPCDLQSVCDKLKIWADKWQMRIAFNKCTVQRISNRDNLITCNPGYSIGGHVLLQTNETRDLGVIIDNKLKFNSYVSTVVHKAHMRANVILRTFVTRDPDVLVQAFITYVRPILEYCTPVWSPYTVCNINKIESCQRWFTKRIKGLFGLDYTHRLAHLGLETLQIRRIKYDLQLCFKIINGDISLHCNMFDLSNLTHTRGHKYKLYKHQSNVNAHKYFFRNRVCDIWNMLPEYVVDAPSSDSFKRRLNSIDLSQFVVLP